MAKHKMTFDGIGFVNNRGASKYYGVTRTIDNRWFVSIQETDKLAGRSLYFHGIRGKEEHAAQIAAVLYQSREKTGSYPEQINVTMIDGVQYFVDVKNKMIIRPLIKSGSEPSINSIHRMDSVNKPSVRHESSSLSLSDKKFVADFVNGYIKGEISKEGADLIVRLANVISR